MSCIYATDKVQHDQDKQIFNDPVYQCEITGELCIYQFPSDIYCRLIREGKPCEQ